ncbi:hypothetical protein PSTT_12505, partial [Puccinia striiformis]
LFNKFAIDHDDHWEVYDAALDHKIYGNSSVIGSMEEIRPLFAVDQVEIQMDIEQNPLKEINIHSSDHDLTHKISSPSHEGDQGLSHRIQPPSNGVYQHLLRIYDPEDDWIIPFHAENQDQEAEEKKKIKTKKATKESSSINLLSKYSNQYENHYPIINQYTSLDSCFDYLLSIESSPSAISALIVGLAIVMIWVVFIIKS